MRDSRLNPSSSTTWNRPKADPQPCTECRKRRIPCQRPFPCAFCEQNGLAAACLQSTIVKGTRSLKPGAIAMHEDLAKMSKREQELSEALAELQSLVSNDQHPLLVRDPQIRTSSPVPGLQRLVEPVAADPREEADEILALGAAMGSLQIGSKQYHGDTVSSEHLVKEENEEQEQTTLDLPAKRKPPTIDLDGQIRLYSVLFPINDEPPCDDMQVFLQYLPDYERALLLFNNYHAYYSWNTSLCTDIVMKEQTFDVFYPRGQKIQALDRKQHAQNLALLLMILLLGTLYDVHTDIEQVTIDMERYHTLARAAMGMHPINMHPSIPGIRAIVLMIWYFRLYPGRTKREYQWVMSGILSKAVIAAGLHRDSSRWFSAIERTQYEQTFWEFYCNDIWMSYMFGRPTSMVTLHIDCKRPLSVEVPSDQHPDFFPWKYSFTQLVGDIATKKTTTYEETLELEKLLKAHPLPDTISWPKPDEPLPDEPPGKLFQRYIASVWRNAPIFYIHRRWVPELLKSYKTVDPTTSPYWGSAVASYESARVLVRDMIRLWKRLPALIERMAPFWSHTGSAAIALGTLVACVPNCDFAGDALAQLEETIDMFTTGTKSLQPPGVLDTLCRLQMKARYAFDRERREHSTSIKEDDTEMLVSPSEIYFPYSFGDQSTTPPASGDMSMQPEMDPQLGLATGPRTNGYSNAYDVVLYPATAWNDMLANNLEHMRR
ncbi:hypothetical protein M422DRAFT_23815 [Sphaerobolus stellatus SS14]|nr:hypothetical protein M422DRAFT_23815 [Sphaerobolus stellatus SS14]